MSRAPVIARGLDAIAGELRRARHDVARGRTWLAVHLPGGRRAAVLLAAYDARAGVYRVTIDTAAGRGEVSLLAAEIEPIASWLPRVLRVRSWALHELPPVAMSERWPRLDYAWTAAALDAWNAFDARRGAA